MKKLLKFACLSASLCMIFFSCKEEETNELNADYANYTVEENKENIQNEGLAVLEKMDAMKEMACISSIQDLMKLLMNQPLDVYYEVANLMAPLAKADKNILGVAALRASNPSMDSLSNVFEYFGGVYTYNPSTQQFDREANMAEITYKFPIGTSTTNNGTLTIDNYTCKYATNEDFAGQEMPKSLRMTVKNGNTTLVSFTMSASYDNNDLPATESTVLTFKEGYTFTQQATYNPTDVAWDFNMEYDGKAFFTGGFDLTGSFGYEKLKALDTEGETEGEGVLEDLINTVNASVQLGNLKVVGKIAYAQMMKDMKELSAKETAITDSLSYVAYIDDECAAYNKNLDATILYSDSKEAIAKLVFYKNMYIGEKSSWPRMDFKMKFKDDSAMDGDFFDTGFSELQTALSAFVADMKANYGFSGEDYVEIPN